jgi:hypothetical protein
MGQSTTRRLAWISPPAKPGETTAPAYFRNFGLKPKFRIYKALSLPKSNDFYRPFRTLAYGIVIA